MFHAIGGPLKTSPFAKGSSPVERNLKMERGWKERLMKVGCVALTHSSPLHLGVGQGMLLKGLVTRLHFPQLFIPNHNIRESKSPDICQFYQPSAVIEMTKWSSERYF